MEAPEQQINCGREVWADDLDSPSLSYLAFDRHHRVINGVVSLG